MNDLFGNNNNNGSSDPERNNDHSYGVNEGNNGYDNNYNNGYYGGSDYYNRDNNGYYNGNNFGGNMYPQNQFSPPPEKKGSGFAIAAFVIAIVNLLLCRSLISIITVPLCLIFAIISLAGRRNGKAFAIFGIVLSLISAFIFGFYVYICAKILPDVIYFMENDSTIIEEFERDGTIPEKFEKYRDPKFDRYWKRGGYADFDDFFSDYIKRYKSQNRYNYGSDYGRSGSEGHTNLAFIK